MTKLPAQFFYPLAATPTTTSPLAKAIEGMLYAASRRNNWNGYTTRQAPFPLETVGLLTLMQLFDYDPNGRVTRHSEGNPSLSLLEAVLELAQYTEGGSHQRYWPLTLEGLAAMVSSTEMLNPYDGVSVEFLAATLLASGTDPWAEVSEVDPLGRVLPLALINHMPGLAERMWQCEAGRPSLEALATAEPWGKNKKAITCWLDWATEQVNGAATVAWLLNKGMVPDNKTHPLARASSTAVIEAYRRHGAPPDQKTRDKILLAWQGRLNRQSMEQPLFLEMKQALTLLEGEEISASSRRDEEIIAAITKEYGVVPWRKEDPVRWTSGWSTKERSSLDESMHRVFIPAGVLSGQWNLLTSWIFRRLRAKKRKDYDLGWKLSEFFGPIEGGFQSGSLSNAIGFDWRPGISINGLVAFSLCYIQGENHKKSLEQALDAFGIEDFNTWLFEQHASMVGFSRAFFKGDNAKEEWRTAWQHVFFKNPDLIEKWGDFFTNLRGEIDPVASLDPSGWGSGNREETLKFNQGEVVFRGNPFSRWWVKMNHRDGENVRYPMPENVTNTPSGTTELIDTALILGNDQPEWWEAAERRANQGQLLPHHQQQIKNLLNDLSKQGEVGPITTLAQAKLKSLMLSASIPAASSVQKTRF